MCTKIYGLNLARELDKLLLSLILCTLDSTMVSRFSDSNGSLPELENKILGTLLDQQT